jgi:CheY-like chemotaxis protein
MAKARILLVDDDPDLIETLCVALATGGYECIHAAGGDQALEMLRRERPDLIVLDVMMDDMTEGFQVAYRIRRPEPGLEPFARIPILMLTSIPQKTGMTFDPAKDGEFLPVDDFVEKPVQPALLLEKVQALLARTPALAPDRNL